MNYCPFTTSHLTAHDASYLFKCFFIIPFLHCYARAHAYSKTCFLPLIIGFAYLYEPSNILKYEFLYKVGTIVPNSAPSIRQNCVFM